MGPETPDHWIFWCADLVEDLLGALDLGGEEGGVTLGHLLLRHPHVVTLHSPGRWLTEVSTKCRGKQYFAFKSRYSLSSWVLGCLIPSINDGDISSVWVYSVKYSA